MTAERGQRCDSLTKAELRARLIGNSLDHDQEDIMFWRNASDTLRGQTLYRLLARGKAIRAAVPHVIEQQDDAMRLVLTPGHAEILKNYE